MGHRASYAILEDGRVGVFYSHWGALTVPQDVFWGPAVAEAFILSLKETGAWLDDVFGEGGVALNKDAKTIAFFGGEDLDLPAVRPVFVQLMSWIWAEHGWTVSWVHDMTGIAACVGVDPESVRAAPMEPVRIDIDRFGRRFAEEDMYQGMISVRRGAGWGDHIVDHPLAGLLVRGPMLLNHLDRLPDLATCRAVHERRDLKDYEDRRGTLGDHLSQCAVIDPTERRLIYRGNGYGYEPSDAAFVRAAWPEWQVEWIEGTVADHMEATGRAAMDEHRPVGTFDDDPNEGAPTTEGEVLALIRSEVLRRRAKKSRTAALSLQVAEQTEGVRGVEGEPWWRRLVHRLRRGPKDGARFAEGFFDQVPTVGPEGDDAEQLFERAALKYRS